MTNGKVQITEMQRIAGKRVLVMRCISGYLGSFACLTGLSPETLRFCET